MKRESIYGEQSSPFFHSVVGKDPYIRWSSSSSPADSCLYDSLYPPCQFPSCTLKMLAFLVMLALSVQQVFAFPSFLSEALNKRHADQALADSPCPHMAKLAKRQAPGITPPFNAAEQYVSNTGANAFVPPGPTDQRGPCEFKMFGRQNRCEQ